MPDGRLPRVKSDLKKKNRNKKKNNRKLKNSRRGFGRSLDFGSEDNEIEEDTDVEDFNEVEDEDEDYVEPEVRPDGKKPRIKSDIKVKDNNNLGKGAAGRLKSRRPGPGFRHSLKVDKPSSTGFSDTAQQSLQSDDLNSGRDNAVTTFRPVINLEHLPEINETLPDAAAELSVPLPNLPLSEPAFSDLSSGGLETPGRLVPPVQSVTEIVRVSSKDQNLFNSDYYDYYDDYS